MDKGPY
ncbi:unnamed protein product [Gulo gulo]|nr:unnamed protein product [Gulo gulo]